MSACHSNVDFYDEARRIVLTRRKTIGSGSIYKTEIYKFSVRGMNTMTGLPSYVIAYIRGILITYIYMLASRQRQRINTATK